MVRARDLRVIVNWRYVCHWTVCGQTGDLSVMNMDGMDHCLRAQVEVLIH